MKKLTGSIVSALVLAAVLAAVPAHATIYSVDPAHSSVSFKIRHLVSKVTGRFHKFEGTIEIDPAKRDSVLAKGSVEVASIDTDEAKRDAHLRGADFFDAGQFPTITFTGGSLSEVDGERNKGKFHGELTMRGITKPIVLDVEWLGTVTDPWGNKKAGLDATGTLNRKDFGIVWNKLLDSGGLMIGDDVQVELHLEMVEAKPQ